MSLIKCGLQQKYCALHLIKLQKMFFILNIVSDTKGKHTSLYV